MTFTIPMWTVWLIGVPVGLGALALAFVGGLFLWNFRNGPYR